MSGSRDSFADFYRATHGRSPFPWQERLAASEALPGLIDIPTGCGKTSALDVLAWRGRAPGGARRVVWVVDRRLVVDDVFEHARAIERAHGIRAVKWRGGMTLDESWLLAPHEPALIVSTVDQVGSRLLFRGYGVPWKARPVFAGLLAFDTVLVLDEVHLSRQFARVLERVAELAPPPEGADLHDDLPPPLRVIQMSATPGATDDAAGTADHGPPFSLGAEDFETPELAQRLATHKTARLVETEESRFREAVAAAAHRLADGEDARVVGVVVNRVADARALFETLRADHRAVLLTGRIRPFDRDLLLASPELERARPGREREPGTPPLFVVATQTVEVGVDLDFDALVTEAAPITALRQRFGRLDRLGHRGRTEAVIVLRKGSRSGDPIYGDALGATWTWLRKQAARTGNGPAIDLGLAAEHDWPDGEEPAGADSREPGTDLGEREAAILAETHPYLAVDVDVARLLHGDPDDHHRVSLIWRRELNHAPEASWGEIVDLCPPVRSEALALPRRLARDWLRARGLRALRWRPGEESAIVRPGSFEQWGEIRHEEILVLPARHRGNDAFGWNPDLPEGKDPEPEDQDVGFHPDFLDSEAFRGLERVAHEPEDEEERRKFTPYPPAWGLDGGIVDHRESSRSTARRESLASHTAKARAEGERIVHGILSETAWGIDPPGDGPEGGLAADLLLALEIHDLGKADRRFQVMLHDGDEIEAVRALAEGDLLAKSSTDWWNLTARNRAWAASGLPRGWRHEVESVLRADLQPAIDRDLVKHLVLAHHGRGRPWLPASDQALPAIDQAERFWRLHRRVGPWGLGYLEALVVVADRRASRDPEEREDAPPLELPIDRKEPAPAPDEPIVETAFVGSTFLGFMAAVGTLRLLGDLPVRLSWHGHRARLHGLGPEAILDAVRAALERSEFVRERTRTSADNRLPWEGCGGGRAQLRDVLPKIQAELVEEASRLERTLFGPWTWRDKGDALGWAPAVFDHALRAQDPSADQRFRENGALWLAWEGIEVFGRRPGREQAVGWFRPPGEPWSLHWPLWAEPASLDTVRSLVRSLPRRPGDLGATEWWTVSAMDTGGRARELTIPRPASLAELARARTSANRK